VGTIVLSAIVHALGFGALILLAALRNDEQPKTYVVNLVPAIAAVGSPQGRSTPAPTLPPRTVEDTAPTPPAKTQARELPTREARVTPPPPPMPPRPSARETVRESVSLPDRSLAVRSAALPKAANKDVPKAPEREAPKASDKELPKTPERDVAKAGDKELPKAADRELPKLADKELPRPDNRELPPSAPRRGPIEPPSRRERPTLLARAPSDLPQTREMPAAPPRTVSDALPAKREVPLPPPAPLGQAAGSTHGAGAVTLSVSDFPYAWYIQAIHRKIQENWQGRALDGRQPEVIFEIGVDGQLRRVSIGKTSGNAAYDQIALRAVGDANPFPPLPREFGKPTLTVGLQFIYDPRTR
jgi:TonB family protein